MQNLSGKYLFSKPWAVLIILILLALIMRIFSFFSSVIDHDESTYIVIAEALRDGDVYLKDVVDTKPIGIFILFAFFQSVFGKSILIIRVITALWVALTAWMLYFAHRTLNRNANPDPYDPAPAATGIMYVMATSIYTYFGISPNTEIFFALFSVSALVLVLRHIRIPWFFLAGFLLGLGFMIKYVVLFDALAIGLFYVWKDVRDEKPWTHWFTRGTAMAIGFSVPFGITWLYYLGQGMEDTFYFFTFELSSRYFSEPPVYRYGIYLLEHFSRFLPLTVWYFYCLWKWRTTGPGLPFLAMLWGAMVIFIILIPGKLFGHYYIQFLPPLCLLAGSFFDSRRILSRGWAWMRKPVIGYPIIALLIGINLFFQKKDYFDKPDYPKMTAAYLNATLRPGDRIYTGDYHQIVYYLTGLKSPTPYVHRSLLWDADNYEALGIHPSDAFLQIFQQRPRFVLIEKKLTPEKPIYHILATSYQLVKNIDNRVLVYERI